jgi:hypothetical protein
MRRHRRGIGESRCQHLGRGSALGAGHGGVKSLHQRGSWWVTVTPNTVSPRIGVVVMPLLDVHCSLQTTSMQSCRPRPDSAAQVCHCSSRTFHALQHAGGERQAGLLLHHGRCHHAGNGEPSALCTVVSWCRTELPVTCASAGHCRNVVSRWAPSTLLGPCCRPDQSPRTSRGAKPCNGRLSLMCCAAV